MTRALLLTSAYALALLRTELAQLRNENDPAPGTAAALDLRLTRSFLDYGADLLSGRLDPGAVRYPARWGPRASVDSARWPIRK